MPTRVIALGQRLAGDDAAGLLVADRLLARGLPPTFELLHVTTSFDLVTALDTEGDVIIIDAVLGEPPGRVLVLSADDLARDGIAAVSSHGLDLPAAVALAAVLSPRPRRVRVVGVVIGAARRFSEHVSAPVRAAIDVAVERIFSLGQGL